MKRPFCWIRFAEWGGRAVPPVLLSGNHAAIHAWRQAEAEKITRDRRPDLWAAYTAQIASTAASP